jgi:hypothetical protein
MDDSHLSNITNLEKKKRGPCNDITFILFHLKYIFTFYYFIYYTQKIKFLNI